jgi:hypothetical protein
MPMNRKKKRSDAESSSLPPAQKTISNLERELTAVDVPPGIGVSGVGVPGVGVPGVGVPGVGIPAVSSISTSVFKNVKGWWDTRMKGEGKNRSTNGMDQSMPWSIAQTMSATVLHDTVTTPYDESESAATSGNESEEGMAKLAVLPSALTVKTFAQQTIDRAREQQRSHHEFVALLRENRQKARPLKTGKSYERVQRWWVVRAAALQWQRC